MKLRLAGFFFTLFSISGFSQSVNEESKVLNLSASKFSWMINHNYDSLDFILHDHVTYVHSNGWSQTKKEVIEDLRSGKLVMKAVVVQSSAVRIFNQTAIVNGQGKFTGVINGVAFSSDLVYSEGYIKENGMWFLVSRLATKVIK